MPIKPPYFGSQIVMAEISSLWSRRYVLVLHVSRLYPMSKHKDPKTVIRYDHGRENLDQNAVNFLGYDEE